MLDERVMLYSVQLPNCDVPSTHAVLPAGGAATELLPLLHAPSSANTALSSSRLNFVRRRIFFPLARVTGLPIAVTNPPMLARAPETGTALIKMDQKNRGRNSGALAKPGRSG